MKRFIRSVRVLPAPTDLRALLYISDTLLPHHTAARELATIVAVSRRNNFARQITGALMVTERHFVQFLEGPDAALEALLAKLHADGRHQNLRVLSDDRARSRHFGHWSLAYCGPQTFLADFIDDAMRTGRGGAQARDELVLMMAAFAGAALPEGEGENVIRG
ncbi:hypothetical protein GCM10011393_10660 [Sphingopyxis bauzanensis]|nr:hypothetical protein GCM10011393_10660 [Sphingopyxis bauzanensis]